VLVRRLHSLGIKSDLLEVAALVSIFGSIAVWRRAKGTDDTAHGERLAIFIGLWAPTFLALGDQLVTVENA